VLGESAAMGDPDPAYGFSRYLETMLRQRYPAWKFEIVNTGSVAINSHVTLPIAEQLAKYQPDLFIIYSGNNEVVGPYGPGTALASAWGMQRPSIHASMFLRSTRTGQLVTKLGTPKQQWRGMELFLDKQVPETSPLLKYAYQNFESNLRDTISVAQKVGARVIVSTVATNVKDCAPFASLHREGLSPDALASWTALVEKGSGLEERGSYADALKQYQNATELDDTYAELHFRIARTLLALGSYEEANRHYVRARNLDSLRFRADSRINEINRMVATSMPGVDLVDANAILSRASEHGAIGSEMVYEHVHMTPEGNYLLARAMFDKIESALPSEAADKTASVPTQAECDQMLGLTKFDRARLAVDVLQRMQRPPFTNQLNHAEQIARYSALSQASQETPYETVAQYHWALDQKPDDLMLHYRLGVFLLRFNRPAAAQQLRLSKPWDDFPVFLPDGTMIE
jgi:tetratricopeptide (TPR) repeat protein